MEGNDRQNRLREAGLIFALLFILVSTVVGFWLNVPPAGAQATDPVRPILECVVNNNDRSYTAFFGYENENTVAVTIPIGTDNSFNPAPQDRGQPTTFQPRRTDVAFSVAFDGNNLVWTFASRFPWLPSG